MTSNDTASQIAYLARVLKAPALRESAGRLAERARADGWTHAEYLAACLEAEVATRAAHGAASRIRAAGFPARKTIEDFDSDHQRSVKRDHILHLATLDFITAKTNIVLLGPPGTGKTMLATGLGIKACQAGHRVLFATAAAWTGKLTTAHRAGRCRPRSPAWAATRCWSSTRSATSPSNPKPPACSSGSCTTAKSSPSTDPAGTSKTASPTSPPPTWHNNPSRKPDSTSPRTPRDS
jgi:hypothetical protein